MWLFCTLIVFAATLPQTRRFKVELTIRLMNTMGSVKKEMHAWKIKKILEMHGWNYMVKRFIQWLHFHLIQECILLVSWCVLTFGIWLCWWLFVCLWISRNTCENYLLCLEFKKKKAAAGRGRALNPQIYLM